MVSSIFDAFLIQFDLIRYTNLNHDTMNKFHESSKIRRYMYTLSSLSVSHVASLDYNPDSIEYLERSWWIISHTTCLYAIKAKCVLCTITRFLTSYHARDHKTVILKFCATARLMSNRNTSDVAHKGPHSIIHSNWNVNYLAMKFFASDGFAINASVYLHTCLHDIIGENFC